MRRQPDGNYNQFRQDAADIARHMQYYTSQSQQQSSQIQPVQRRSRHRSTSSSMPPIQQYVYQSGAAMMPSRPRQPASEANDMIDAMCSLSPHEAYNLEWILDLEYGPPLSKPPAHRHIAYYDSSKRIVMSASQPNTVHPDFIRCNEHFRDMLIEHYIRREMHAQALYAQMPQQAPQPPGQAPLPLSYPELYRMMEEQRSMQNALIAASARQTYNSRLA